MTSNRGRFRLGFPLAKALICVGLLVAILGLPGELLAGDIDGVIGIRIRVENPVPPPGDNSPCGDSGGPVAWDSRVERTRGFAISDGLLPAWQDLWARLFRLARAWQIDSSTQ
jgi:hypothetical protein